MENHLRHLPKLEKGDTCLNCGSPLQDKDNFCPRCGQVNDTKRLSFVDWIKEILGDFFAYDSRLSNSLIPLLKNPGQLSIDYIKGQRASHIHPIRLYLVVSFILFFFTSIESWKTEYTDNPTIKNLEVIDSDKEIKKIEGSSIDIAFDSIKINDTLANNSKNNYTDRFLLFMLEIKRNNIKTYDEILDKYNFEKRLIDKYIFKKALDYSTFSTDKLGELIYEKLPIVSFIFLPFFVIFLNLFHRKKDILYLEHLVFAFHVQTVLFLLLTISTIIGIFLVSADDMASSITLFLIFPIYLFLALKKFYKYSSIKKAIFMFITLNSVYIIVALLAFFANILFAFFSY